MTDKLRVSSFGGHFAIWLCLILSVRQNVENCTKMFLIFRRQLCKVPRSAKLRGDVKKRITSWRLFRMFRSRVGLWNHCLKQTEWERKSICHPLKHLLKCDKVSVIKLGDITVKAEIQTCFDSDSEYLQKAHIVLPQI